MSHNQSNKTYLLNAISTKYFAISGKAKAIQLAQSLTVIAVAITLVFSPLVMAEVSRLKIPKPQFLIGPIKEPTLANEGFLSNDEQFYTPKIISMISQGNYEEALIELNKSHALVTAELESGVIFSPDMPSEIDEPEGSEYLYTMNNTSSGLFFLIGYIYFSLEEYDTAETAFKSALVIVPDYVRVIESLGYLYLITDRQEEAREQLIKIASLGLETTNVYLSLGYLNQESSNFWGAIASYQMAMTLDPDNPELAQGLLYALYQSGQYDSALTLTEQMLLNNPDDSELWILRAHIAYEIENTAKTLSSLEVAIRLGDVEISTLHVAATIHMEQGSVNRAVELIQQAAANGLSFTYYDQTLNWFSENDEWNALENLLDTIPYSFSLLSPEQQSKLLTRQASLDIHNDQAESARAKLEQAIDIDEANGLAMVELARIYQDRNNYNQADFLYQRVGVNNPYWENVMISRASMAIDQGNYSLARELLLDVFERNPSRFDIQRSILQLDSVILTSPGN